MITKTCEVCGASFDVKPYRKDSARFCSQACGGKWHMSSRSMPNDHKIGNNWRKGKRPANAFTSEQARLMNLVEGELHQCANCSASFRIKPWIARQNTTKSGLRFCSKKCHSEHMASHASGENSHLWVGGITTYRGKGWLAARKAAVKRDDGTCKLCKKVVGDSIPVHHIKPFRQFDSAEAANKLENLVCLCQSCHMKTEIAEERRRRAESART